MNTKNEWPLSLEEMQNIAKPLAATVSFVALASNHCKKIESIASATFTHRCICPNPFHKNGAERSPSFYFSEKDKFYKCFGCNISGDIFDFITLTDGIPWHDVVASFIKNGSATLQSLQEASSGISEIELANFVFDLNIDISHHVRRYLASRRNTKYYEKECKWADHLFKRVDETFAKLADTDFEQAKSFHAQILMEISRRELLYKEDEQEAK